MKKVFLYIKQLFLLLCLVFISNGFVFSIDWSIHIDNCNNGKYDYDKDAGLNCNICGYHKDRLYLGDPIDSWDWFFNTLHKELVFSSSSYSNLKFLNGADGVYTLYNGGKTLIDLLPSNIAINGIKEAIIFIIKGIKVTVPPSILLKDKPAFIEIYHVRFASTSSSGIPLIPPDKSGKWVWTKGVEYTTSGGILLNTYREYLDSNKRYFVTSNIKEHNECYVGLVSRCGDGVIQSDEGEHCDNGTDNWDGSGDPIVKNGVVCNTSCQVVQPTCGSAAKTYPVSATSYGSDTFCGKSYETVVPANPAFPSKGGSSSWTCKLGNQSVSCSASRSNDTTPIPGGGGGGRGGGGEGGGTVSCGTSNGETLNSKPTTNLCSDGSSPSVSDDGRKWTWTCGTDSCSANKSACAIAGTCSVGNCGPLASTIYNGSSKINELKDPYKSAYHNDFCTNGAILSPQYDPSITSKQFKWYCGTTLCSADIQFNKGVIKIYGAYSGASIWACPECNGFDEETWNGIKHKFLSDYDTQYTRSIMSGDYLPFGWILPKYKNYVSSCNSSNIGKWNKNTVKVQFKAINGNGTVVYTTPVLNGFGGSLPAFNDNSVVGESYIPASQTHKFSMGENSIKGYIVSRKKCEGSDTNGDGTIDSYNWVDDVPTVPFASQTFTVTAPYMLQLGTTFSNVSNVDLHFNGSGLSYYGISPVNTINNYDTGALSKVLGNFINKYKQYAVLPDQHLFGDTTVSYKKLLTKEVYYLSGNDIAIHGEVTQPTTILVETGNVTINGDITGPLMLVVKNGKIIFQNANMNKQTILDGYYITDKGFEVAGPASTHNIILNTNPSSSRWYADGRLEIKGVLIGPNANEIYKNRRSVLKNYFRNGFGPAWAIKHGASLTITSNPDLWLNAPVGSKDLFGMLKVSKGY